MKELFVVMAVLGVNLSPAWAQLGGFSKPNVPGGGATAEEINKFLGDTVVADTLVQKSSMQLLKAVVSKQKYEKIDAEMKAAMAIQDPKEREAKVNVVQAEVRTELMKVNFQEVNAQLKAKADTKKNQAIGHGLWNLALGGLKDVELVNSGKKLVSGPPRPEVAGKISEVKQAIEKLASQGEGVTKILGSAKVLMSTVGLESLPQSATESPKFAERE